MRRSWLASGAATGPIGYETEKTPQRLLYPVSLISFFTLRGRLLVIKALVRYALARFPQAVVS